MLLKSRLRLTILRQPPVTTTTILNNHMVEALEGPTMEEDGE